MPLVHAALCRMPSVHTNGMPHMPSVHASAKKKRPNWLHARVPASRGVRTQVRSRSPRCLQSGPRRGVGTSSWNPRRNPRRAACRDASIGCLDSYRREFAALLRSGAHSATCSPRARFVPGASESEKTGLRRAGVSAHIGTRAAALTPSRLGGHFGARPCSAFCLVAEPAGSVRKPHGLRWCCEVWLLAVILLATILFKSALLAAPSFGM